MTRKTFVLLCLILIIAGALRLYHLKSAPPGLYPDEAMNGSNAVEALRTGDFAVFYPDNGGREGLFINIQAFFVKLLGREPWALRLPSAIFGILTVLAAFFLTRELYRFVIPAFSYVIPAHLPAIAALRRSQAGAGIQRVDTIALLSAFFLATSFWHINFSRIGFRAITASFFLGWALYFFLRAINGSRGPGTHLKTPPARVGMGFEMGSGFYILNSIFSGLFFGLGFYSYLSYRITPLLFLLFIPFFFRRRDFWTKAACFAAAAFLAALPLGIYFLEHPADFTGRTAQISIFNSETPLRDLGVNIVKTAAMFNLQGDWNWRHNVAGRPELFWPVGILFLIGLFFGIREIALNRRGERLPSAILIFWLVLAALPVMISNEGLPHALRAILMILPIFILAARGGELIYMRLSRQIPAKYLNLGAALLLIILVFEAWHTYFIIWARNPNVAGAFSSDYAAIGQEIKNLPVETQKYIVIPETAGTQIRDPLDGKVRNVPLSAQNIVFLTDSFSTEGQRESNVYYRYPRELADIPSAARVFYLR